MPMQQPPEQQQTNITVQVPTSLIQIRGGNQQQVVIDKPVVAETHHSVVVPQPTTMIKLGGITAGPALQVPAPQTVVVGEEQKKPTAFISIPAAATQPQPQQLVAPIKIPAETVQVQQAPPSTIRLPIFQQPAPQQTQSMVVDQYSVQAQQQKPLITQAASQIIKVGGAEPSPKQASETLTNQQNQPVMPTTSPKKPQPIQTASVPIRLNISSGAQQPQQTIIQQPTTIAVSSAPCLIKIGGGSRTPEPPQKAVVTSTINIMSVAAPPQQKEMVQETPVSIKVVSQNQPPVQGQITLKFGGVSAGPSQATIQQTQAPIQQQPIPHQPLVSMDTTPSQPQKISLQQQQQPQPQRAQNNQAAVQLQQNTTNTIMNNPTNTISPNYPVYVPQAQLQTHQGQQQLQQPIQTNLVQIGGSQVPKPAPAPSNLNANAGKITFNLTPSLTPTNQPKNTPAPVPVQTTALQQPIGNATTTVPVEPSVPVKQQQVVMPAARSFIKISMPTLTPPQTNEQPVQPSQSTINPSAINTNTIIPQQTIQLSTQTQQNQVNQVLPQIQQPEDVEMTSTPATVPEQVQKPQAAPQPMAAITIKLGGGGGQQMAKPVITKKQPEPASSSIISFPTTATVPQSATTNTTTPMDWQPRVPQQTAAFPTSTATVQLQSQATTNNAAQHPVQQQATSSQQPSSQPQYPLVSQQATTSQSQTQSQAKQATNAGQQSRSSKSQPKRLNLLEFYNVSKRTVAFELDPETKTYRGQVRIELALKMVSDGKTATNKQQSVLEKEIEQCKAQGMSRVLLEANIMAKQVKVVEVCLLHKDSETGEFKKEQTQKFADGNLADPVQQAKVNPQLYQGLSRHLYQLEDVQKSQTRKYLTHGTVQLKLKKKMFQFKNAEKIKKELFFMIDFLCEHITDVGGVKCVKYRKELADQLASSANNAPIQSCNEYFYTSDEPNQSISWLPQLVGSQKMASAWHLQFLVPKEYTVIASGKRIDSSIEDDTALFEYDITEAERTIPDRIGFLICPTPLQTPFDVQGKKEMGAANFLSRQKQANFNPKLAADTIDFICSLMSQRNYPSKNTQICFLPNLFPSKFPKQSLCFAGGLYMLDQELLYKPNQLDKRHKLYKQLASCLTFAFFGGKVREAEWSDTWLLVAIRERVGDRFTKSKCGALLYRYHVMKRIEKLYKLMKEGIETHPLQRTKLRDPETCPELRGLGCPDPADQIANDIFYRKCGLVMQMIELKIGELLDTILKEMYQEAVQSKDRVLQLESFRATYKKVCGIRAKEIFNNWIFSTSCPKLTLNYEFNKRYNSLDLTLKQESAAATSMRVHKNVQSKIDKIFGMSGQDLDRELLGEGAETNETFNVDQKQVCKRWFTGSVNVVICQADGGGGEILKQQHKMTLKNYKSTVSAHITLLGRVRRTQNRKKDLDYLPQAAMQTPQETHHVSQAARRLGPGGRPHHGPHGQRGRTGSDFGASDAATSQAAQMMLNQDVQKFEMNEFELEDFPPETKNIFRKELDNNPVLWIRVDPGMEYIRKVKVVQKKRNNWLFQLLREQDIVGQIEAVRQLHKFNEDLVYEILKTVSRNENYFFKVRKEVLKAMHKMEISVINEHLSHEAFLLKCFNQKNFDKVTGFYRENNFTNLLQYYLDRSVLKYISKSKEEKLNLTMTSQQRLDELHMKQSKLANESNMEDAASEKTPQKERSVDPNSGEQPGANMQAPSTMIQINFASNQLTGIDTKGQKNGKSRAKVRSSALARQHMIDMSDYRTTTDKVAQMLLKVLEQNDNTENYFDDSFLIRDILASLGRLDNLNYLAKIATEIYRQFKLDQISNSSPMFSITTGAIKGYFNTRKQIFRFEHHKRQHIEPSDPFYQHRVKMHGNESGHLGGHNTGAVVKEQRNAEMLAKDKDQIAEAENILDSMKEDIDGLLMDPLTPLQLRLFIFDEEIKNLIFYKSLPLVKALQVIFDAIFNLQAKMEIRFAVFCLRELVMFLESVKFVQRINFTELFIESEATIHLMETVWSLVCLPHGFLSSDMTFWAKRFVNRVYGRVMPKFLMNRADMTLEPAIYQTDDLWAKTEVSLAAEEQARTQLAELQKQEQKNKHLMATHQFQSAQQAQGDQSMTVAQLTTNANVLAFRSSSGNERIVAGGSKQQPLKKKTINRQGSVGDKQIIQIYNRGQTPSGGITIKATNNSQASMPTSTNDHILNITSGNQMSRHPSAKISIPGPSSTIRVTATAAPATAINVESKLQSELREVNTASILAQSGANPLQSQVYNDASKDAAGNKKTAVVHIGPQTHTAITLQAPHVQQALLQQQSLEAAKASGQQPMQLIVLRGQSLAAPNSAAEQGEASLVAGGHLESAILSSGNDQEMAQAITSGPLGQPVDGDVVMGQPVAAPTMNAAAESEDEDFDQDNSKSMARILPRAQTADGNAIVGGGNQQQVQVADEDEDEDEDEDLIMSDQSHVVQQRLIQQAKQQQRKSTYQDEDGDAQMMDDDDEDEYGDQIRQQQPQGDDDDDDDDDEDDDEDDNESVYDPFAAEKMEDPEMQKCWLILGKIYYHYEVTDFLDPVTPDTFGDEKLYEEYCSVVAEPMDIATIMAKMRAAEYESKYLFRRDVMLIFENCREFNEAGTEIVHCANSLTIEFNGLWQEYEMN